VRGSPPHEEVCCMVALRVLGLGYSYFPGSGAMWARGGPPNLRVLRTRARHERWVKIAGAPWRRRRKPGRETGSFQFRVSGGGRLERAEEFVGHIP